MVWGAISMKEKSDIWINERRERVNKEQYVEIIRNLAVPLIRERFDEDAVLLHDCATPHTAKYTAEKLRDFNIQKNPAHSPDLNPVEMMWAILKRNVAAHNPNNREDLIKLTRIAWNSIPNEVIISAIQKFQTTICVRVIESNGEFII